jgi:hypothetical protein
MGWSNYIDVNNVACMSAGSAKCLVKAYNERTSAWKIPDLSPITAHLWQGCQQFDYLLFGSNNQSRLISQFLSPVRRNNLIFQSYTIANLMDELGETLITISGSRLNKFPKDWFLQRVRMLNLLLHKSAPLTHYGLGDRGIRGTWAGWPHAAPDYGYGTSIAAAIASLDIVDYPSGSSYEYLHFSEQGRMYRIEWGETRDYGCVGSSNRQLVAQCNNNSYINKTIKCSVTMQIGDLYMANSSSFNSGSTGMVFGDNIVIDQADIAIPSDGIVDFPPMLGESNNNFGGAPANPGWSGYRGVTRNIIMHPNYEFIAGS